MTFCFSAPSSAPRRSAPLSLLRMLTLCSESCFDPRSGSLLQNRSNFPPIMNLWVWSDELWVYCGLSGGGNCVSAVSSRLFITSSDRFLSLCLAAAPWKMISHCSGLQPRHWDLARQFKGSRHLFFFLSVYHDKCVTVFVFFSFLLTICFKIAAVGDFWHKISKFAHHFVH